MSDLMTDGGEACRYVRAAVFHMLSCWDALNRAEGVTGVPFGADDIEAIAGGLADPGEAMRADDETVRGWIADICNDHSCSGD